MDADDLEVECGDHSRVIVHIDIDCFYAQVEMIKNPSLFNVPLGIQQKNIVVTSNYVARNYGIGKCMLVSEAKRKCPDLILVNGEDLYHYRQYSSKVTAFLQQFSPFVEKLGLDENYVDVTDLVVQHISTKNQFVTKGNIYGYNKDLCRCGCLKRLTIGSEIALEMRAGLKAEFSLTCCAGIAHNKLLAKLAGAANKPDQQTLVYPSGAVQLLQSLKDVKYIPGIGSAVAAKLNAIGIFTVVDLQTCSIDKLKSQFDDEKARLYFDLSYGRDPAPVKPSGRPQSIGLEDACKMTTVADVETKFRQLLTRLMILVREDGRIPCTVKITVRKCDDSRNIGHREQRQCNVLPSLFRDSESSEFNSVAEEKLMETLMHLFKKTVNTQKPFCLTLLGLAFTKFQERLSGRGSIVSFLMKNTDSSIHIQSNTSQDISCTNDCADLLNSDECGSDFEPLSKKSKCEVGEENIRSSPKPDSPNKLHLNLHDSGENIKLPVQCPSNIDPEVFKELPHDIREELIQQWKTEKKAAVSATSKPKTNTILKYLIKKQ